MKYSLCVYLCKCYYVINLCFQLPTLRRKLRTEVSTVPQSADENMCLLVRQAIKSYTSSYQPIRFRYQAYSGSYQQLPTNVYVIYSFLYFSSDSICLL